MGSRWRALLPMLAVPLDVVLAGYFLILSCFIARAWLNLDLRLWIRVDDGINLLIVIAVAGIAAGVAAFSRRYFASSTVVKTLSFVKSLSFIIAGVYSAALAAYWSAGPYKFWMPSFELDGGPALQLLLLASVSLRLLIAALVEYKGSAGNSQPARPAGWRWWAAAAAATAAALIGLRLWSAGQGLEYGIYHPDAFKHINALQHYLARDYSFDLEFTYNRYIAGHPYFGMRFTELALRVAESAATLISYPLGAFSHETCALAARLMNVVYSMVTGWLVYALCRRFGSREVSLLAAAAFAFSITQLQITKDVGADVPMAMFAAGAMYVAALNLERESMARYLLAGALIGLSAAVKYNGAVTFVFLWLVFMARRCGMGDALRHAGYAIQPVIVSALVFFLVTPNLWTRPVIGLQAIRTTGHATSTAWAPVEYGWERIAYLIREGDYNLWVLKGIVDPVPWWLALLGFMAAALFIWRRLWPLWTSAVLMIAIGKYAMPSAASYHFLNAQLLVMVCAVLGLEAIANRVAPREKIRHALTAALWLWMGYWAVMDTSLWKLQPFAHAEKRWVNGNLATWDHINTLSGGGKDDGANANARLIQDFHLDAPPPYTMHRHPRETLWWQPGAAPRYYPMARFAVDEAEAYVFPDGHDLVTTAKVFAAGLDRPASFQRWIRASVLKGPVMLYIHNTAIKENRIRGRIGGGTFDFAMAPGERKLVIEPHPAASILYYGAVIGVEAHTEAGAVFALGVNSRDYGDLLMGVGQRSAAVDRYLESDDLYSLLRAAALAPDEPRLRAAKSAIEKIAPGLMADTRVRSWDEVAGWPARVFVAKTSRKVEGSLVNDHAFKEKEGWVLREGGTLFGPYAPLLAGRYEFSLDWKAAGGVESFTVDVVSRQGRKTLARVIVRPNMGERGTAILPFTIQGMVEHPVEFRVMEVKGGPLIVENLSVRSLYRADLENLLERARKRILPVR